VCDEHLQGSGRQDHGRANPGEIVVRVEQEFLPWRRFVVYGELVNVFPDPLGQGGPRERELYRSKSANQSVVLLKFSTVVVQVPNTPRASREIQEADMTGSADVAQPKKEGVDGPPHHILRRIKRCSFLRPLEGFLLKVDPQGIRPKRGHPVKQDLVNFVIQRDCPIAPARWKYAHHKAFVLVLIDRKLFAFGNGQGEGQKDIERRGGRRGRL
jgi:hypothetical protein